MLKKLSMLAVFIFVGLSITKNANADTGYCSTKEFEELSQQVANDDWTSKIKNYLDANKTSKISYCIGISSFLTSLISDNPVIAEKFLYLLQSKFVNKYGADAFDDSCLKWGMGHGVLLTKVYGVNDASNKVSYSICNQFADELK